MNNRYVPAPFLTERLMENVYNSEACIIFEDSVLNTVSQHFNLITVSLMFNADEKSTSKTRVSKNGYHYRYRESRFEMNSISVL